MITDDKSAFEWLSTLPDDFSIRIECMNVTMPPTVYRCTVTHSFGASHCVYGSTRLEAIQKMKELWDMLPVQDSEMETA